MEDYDKAEEYKKTHKNAVIEANGMTVDTYVHHPNTSVNLSEMYEGVTLLQLQDHDNDEDDIVPELNESVKAQINV